MQVRTFKKGHILLREGQMVNLSHFILKGCIRQYYIVDGEEKNTHFYTEGEPLTPYQTTHNKQSSKFYLACVEDCILTISTPEQDAKLMAMFPHFDTICLTATEEELGKSHEQLASYIIKTPEDRYLDLLKTRPDLFDRVPLYQLASYLGIKPESLSRIRKRIMSK